MAVLNKFFLDYEGLALYDELIKNYIDSNLGDTDKELRQWLEQVELSDMAAHAQLIELQADENSPGSIKNEIKKAVDALVDEAPETLDTLKEIADWISTNEDTASLITRVAKNEKDIVELREDYDAIGSIEELKIRTLFPVLQSPLDDVVAAIENLEENGALKLLEGQVIEADIIINKNCYIDANGSKFEGEVTVPAGVEVVIENAIFEKPVKTA